MVVQLGSDPCVKQICLKIIFDWNTSCHITKLSILKIVTWSYSCLTKIDIIYMKLYDCENKWLFLNRNIAQSAGTVEYTDCTTAEG